MNKFAGRQARRQAGRKQTTRKPIHSKLENSDRTRHMPMVSSRGGSKLQHVSIIHKLKSFLPVVIINLTAIARFNIANGSVSF